MDYSFIKRAERVTSFDLAASDFTSLKHKKEIQYLFTKNLFPHFNTNSAANIVNMQKLNSQIRELKKLDNGVNFSKLHYYNLKGVGPGEVTIFYLVNNAYLGGVSSKVDITSGSHKYEVKAAKISADGIATDFQLGGTVPLYDVLSRLGQLQTSLKLGGSKTEMSAKVMANMRSKDQSSYDEIENLFRDVVYNYYFKNKDFIFVNNTKGPKLGTIEAIKQVSKDEIWIDRVTRGTIKPKVKL